MYCVSYVCRTVKNSRFWIFFVEKGWKQETACVSQKWIRENEHFKRQPKIRFSEAPFRKGARPDSSRDLGKPVARALSTLHGLLVMPAWFRHVHTNTGLIRTNT